MNFINRVLDAHATIVIVGFAYVASVYAVCHFA